MPPYFMKGSTCAEVHAHVTRPSKPPHVAKGLADRLLRRKLRLGRFSSSYFWSRHRAECTVAPPLSSLSQPTGATSALRGRYGGRVRSNPAAGRPTTSTDDTI